MKQRHAGWMGLILAAALLSFANRAPGATLKVGDAAPELKVGKWVQGGPIKSFAPDKAYIVEFWATWCGPCRVSIPHLNEIHTKFKDKGLVVIGQDCWEKDESLVPPFIEKMGDKMTYNVALDDKQDSKKGTMAETWMEAAGQNGIPSAFLVDKKGKIVWIGHPMGLKEEIIEQVLAGTFDVEKAAAAFDKQQKAQEEMAKNQKPLRESSQRLDQAFNAKDWDKAEVAVKELSALLPKENQIGLNGIRLRIALGKGDEEAAGKLIEQMRSSQPDDPMAENEIAWQLAVQEGLKGSLLETAAKIVDHANSLSGGKNPMILDTLARVTFMQGKKDKAIEIQAKALELAEADMKDDLRATLESYKDGKLPSAK